jgi:hypothetical protein
MSTYVRSFLPWIAFGAVSSAGWQWAALAGLVISVWVLMRERKNGTPADSLVLEYSTTFFFAAWTILAFADTKSGVQDYDGAVSMLWLAITAWGSLGIGKPFTTGIAKRQAPPEVWNNPVFVRINVVLTAVWAAAFTLSGIALAVVAAVDGGTTWRIILQVAGLVIPAVFTARYPKRVQARYANANPTAQGA